MLVIGTVFLSVAAVPDSVFRIRMQRIGEKWALLQLRLALEPRVSREPQAIARENLQNGADPIRDTQAVCGFRYWASKHTPLFHTINTMVAIFRAKVSRAISGRMPLASNVA